MIFSTTIASILVICTIILILVSLLLLASSKLQPQGEVNISNSIIEDFVILRFIEHAAANTISLTNEWELHAVGTLGVGALRRSRVVQRLGLFEAL